MATNIVLLHYNNYFNRTVKIAGNLLSDYITGSNSHKIFNDINFDPGDGVLTSLILGKGSEIVDLERENYDYLLVVEPIAETQDSAVITRWFIMNSSRTRLGQYQFDLKRDSIVDNYNAIVDAPIYIEKAHISDLRNPFLYNKEGLNVNQIKEEEYPIQDETKSGWVVGYVPRDIQSGPVDANVYLPGTADYTVSSLSEWSWWKNVIGLNANGKYLALNNGINDVRLNQKARYSRTVYSSGTTTYYTKRYVTFRTGTTLDQYNAYVSNLQSSNVRGVPSVGSLDSWYETWSNFEWIGNTAPTAAAETGYMGTSAVPTLVSNIYNNSTFKGYVNTYLENNAQVEFASSTDTIRQLDSKILFDSGSNLYYRISVQSRTGTPAGYVTVSTGTTAGSNLINFLNSNMTRTNLASYSYQLNGSLASGQVEAKVVGTTYYITLEQLAVSLRVDIPTSANRSHLEDAAYDMFCIPYSDTLQLYDGTDTYTCNKNVALTIATAIGASLGSGNVHDIQLLPYCPCREAITRSSSPSILLDISGISNSPIRLYSGGTYGAKYGALLWCSRSIFDVDVSIEEIGAITHLGEPFETIPAGVYPESRKYYMLSNMPTWQGLRLATTSSNSLVVCKVDKETDKIISSERYNAIEIDDNISNRSLRIYTYGNYSNPEIDMLTSDYMAGSYRFAIYIDSDSYGGANLSNFDMYFTIPSIYYVNADLGSPEEVKISNECDLYRLVSGNYNGIFEFSIAKSGGITGFKVECNYKPWNPYIHVFPMLAGLYGENFVNLDDARGLICGGDFSLTQLSNEWANYQMNNKTYQEMFDRQIKNLDVTQNVQMEQAQYQAVAGIFTGGASGIVAGAAAGSKAGGYGALIGGAVGGTVGTAGGAWGGQLDLQHLETLQKEQRSYSIDMYNYNLQNIQAIPTSITKTTALTQNTRVWPFLEYYTCTDAEKQAFRDKLTYNGMTVMAIGKISDYIEAGNPHFLLGQIIRLPDIMQDSHMANDIYQELLKGVYI